ncbi:MAG: hypothetical protein WAX38_04940 [Minisyncoccia bacterium]
MIEVEIRGRITEARSQELHAKFATSGTVLETQDREMILLKDVPGYSSNPVLRVNDVRLRSTNGMCEVMVKTKASADNTARIEKSYPLTQVTLEEAKELARAFGCTTGQWMHRKKTVYAVDGVHWSLVQAPPDIFYFEAEKEVASAEDISVAEAELRVHAERLGLEVFTPEQTKDFIAMLGREVNKDIQW